MALGFFEPRRSQIDIIQAVGRAIRLSQNKKHGVIFIPIFIEDGDTPEARIESSNFKPVWDIVNALRSHDDVIKEELDQCRFRLAKKSTAVLSPSVKDKMVLDFPESIDHTFVDNLKTILVEKLQIRGCFGMDY